MKILIAILILSLLIFVHEFGHFVVAKICGVHVKEFSLGMGPRLLKFKRKDTLYSIKLFLFGGSCAMSGMDENGDETGEGSYLSKSVWKRMAIIVAGPLFNIILAFLFSVILIGKVGYDPCVVGAVADNSPAYEAGLKPGDKIVKINKKNITFYEDYALYEMEHDGETMEKATEILNELHCPFVINQNRYSILDRNIEKNGILEKAKEHKKGMIIFSPLAQGLLSDRYLNGIPEDSRIKTDGRFLNEKSLSDELLNKIKNLNEIANNLKRMMA